MKLDYDNINNTEWIKQIDSISNCIRALYFATNDELTKEVINHILTLVNEDKETIKMYLKYRTPYGEAIENFNDTNEIRNYFNENINFLTVHI